RTSVGAAGEAVGRAATGADCCAAPRSSPTLTTNAAAYAVMTLEAGDGHVIFAPGPALITSPRDRPCGWNSSVFREFHCKARVSPPPSQNRGHSGTALRYRTPAPHSGTALR